MNRIRKQLSASDVAAQIRLGRAVHSGSFLLVEGSSDSRLFKKLVDQSNCSVTVCHGRENVLAIVDILEHENFCGFLAVVDADFASLTGENIENENVCLTDHNDIECFIIASSSWDNVLIEYGSDAEISGVERRNGKSAKELILEQLAFVGSIRVISSKNGWPLEF